MGNGESREGAGEIEENSWSKWAAKALAVTGAVAAGAALVYHASGSTSQNDKEEEVPRMMKAPGKKGELIERSHFEENPREYFRKSRGKD